MRTKTILFLLAAVALFVSCSEKGGYEVPAPEDVVMYQVNPRNFAPENSFNEVRKHLDDIQDLGVNVVWFMPICEIGVEKAVKSPYCVKNYTAVNPEFGTIDDFKAIVEDCHSRGMAVIIDWVANHTSWDNQWIKDHPEWYTHDEDGNIVHPQGTGWQDVADLNFDNPDMCQAMIDAMKFWVEEIGIDGFRCDAADYVPYEFWKECLDQLRAIEGHPLLMLGEGQRKDHFDAGFDLNYAWGWLSSLRRVYSGETVTMEMPSMPNRNGGNRPQGGRARTINRTVPVSTLFATDSSEYAGIPAGKVKLRFTTNHDEHEKMSPIREFMGQEGSMAAFIASTYIHGGMLIYGCQEVGYPGKIHFFNYCEVDWDANNGLRDEYKKVIQVFKEHPAIRKGDMVPYPDNDVLAFERKDGSENILVVINMRDVQTEAAVPAAWIGKSCVDLITGESYKLADKELMRPFEYMVLK